MNHIKFGIFQCLNFFRSCLTQNASEIVAELQMDLHTVFQWRFYFVNPNEYMRRIIIFLWHMNVRYDFVHAVRLWSLVRISRMNFRKFTINSDGAVSLLTKYSPGVLRLRPYRPVILRDLPWLTIWFVVVNSKTNGNSVFKIKTRCFPSHSTVGDRKLFVYDSIQWNLSGQQIVLIWTEK